MNTGSMRAVKRVLRRIVLVGLIAGAGAYGALALVSGPVRNHPFFRALPEDRAAVIAHRGGAALWPENTIEAFHGARALGADALELDVHRSADGIPVVIHDETVDRTTNGAGAVAEFSLRELQDLDAAHAFSPIDAPDTHPLRGQGITVPTLREVFTVFPDVPMIVEIKAAGPDFVDDVIALVQEFDRVERTLLASFHHDVLTRVRRSDARIATHLSSREAVPFLLAAWLFSGHLVTPPAEALLVPPRRGILPVTTRRFITAANGRNLFVAAWTVNDAQEMHRLLSRGVHGLITDRPDLAVSAVTDAR